MIACASQSLFVAREILEVGLNVGLKDCVRHVDSTF